MAITISGENNNDRILASDGVIEQLSGFNVVGVITATSFTGDLTGDVTGNLTGNVTGNINNSTLLLQTGGTERLRITGNNEIGIAGGNYGSSGQVFTSGGTNSPVSWTTPAVTAFTNGSNNRVITATSGSGLNGESTLTYNGNGTLNILGASGNTQLALFRTDANTTGTTGTIGFYASDNHAVAGLYALGDGDNEGAHLVFKTTSAASGTSVYSNVEERLRITSNGKVNIGTGNLTQTDRMLNVYGGRIRIEGISSGNSFEIMNSASAGSSFGMLIQAGANSSDINSTFRNTSGSTLFRIRGDGVVFVGNSTVQQGSTSKLEVMGTLNNSYPGYSYPIMVTDNAAYNSSAGPGGGIGFSFKQNSGGSYAQAGGIRGIKENTTDGNYASALTFYTRANGAGTVEQLRIDSNGRVLINTTSNANAHTQSDDLVVGNTSHPHDTGITIVSNPSYSGWLAFSDGTSASDQRKAGLIYQHSSDTLYLRNNGNQNRIIITSDGKIGINQTPTRELSLHSPDNNNALIHFTNDDTGETSSDGILVGLNGNEDMIINNQESGKNIIVYTHNGSSVGERLRIKSTGEVHISDRNSSNTGDHFFQAGAFGIRMEDTGGYNRWNIERNYGGFQSTPLVHLSAQGIIGINNSTPGGSGLDITTSRTTHFSESSDQRSLANLVLRQESDAPNRFVGLSFVNGGGTQAEASINLMQTGSYNGDFLFKFRTGGGSTDWRRRFRMTSAGMMGFNTNPNRYLHVAGRTDGGNFGTAAFEQNNTNNSAAVMFMSTLRNGSSAESFLQCNRDQDNNGQGVKAVFYIRTNGDVDSDTNSYGGISDIKLKENIVDAKSQWDDIKNIKVRNFNFKDNPSQKMLGVVAQEVETVSAGLVKDCPDENLKSPGPEGTSTKSVKYSILYMKAIKALQEAQARIETLEAKVAALEGS